MKLSEFARESKETFKGSMVDIPVVGLEHLIPGELTFSEYDVNSEHTFTKAFHKGQILFGRRRAYQRKAAVADFDGICSGDITVIEAIPGKIVPELLPFIIQNDAFFEYAVSRSAGGLSPRVKWADLADFEYNLPSWEEQKKLSDQLWAAYKLKQAYNKLLLASRDLVKSGFIEMFGNPQYCESETILANICNMKAGKAIKSDELKDEGYPCYGGNGLRGYLDRYSHEGTFPIIGRQGALCGNVILAKGQFYATEHAVVVTPKETINNEWLYYCLTLMDFNRLARGVAQPGLSVEVLLNQPIRFPSLPLQEEFAAFARQADKSEFELKKVIEDIDMVIKSLINQQ